MIKHRRMKLTPASHFLLRDIHKYSRDFQKLKQFASCITPSFSTCVPHASWNFFFLSSCWLNNHGEIFFILVSTSFCCCVFILSRPSKAFLSSSNPRLGEFHIEKSITNQEIIVQQIKRLLFIAQLIRTERGITSEFKGLPSNNCMRQSCEVGVWWQMKLNLLKKSWNDFFLRRFWAGNWSR